MYDIYYNNLLVIQQRIKLSLIEAKVEIRLSKMLVKSTVNNNIKS